MALLLGLLAVLAGTEPGARAALAAAEALSGGMLRVQGVHGQLSGPLWLESVVVEQPDRRTVLTDLRIDWRPRALLQKKLHVSSLHVRSLQMTGTPDSTPEPAQLPERIALPFPLQADDVRLAAGEIRSGAGEPLRLGPVSFGLDFDGGNYRLRLRELALGRALDDGRADVRISGEAGIGTNKPYPLQGSFAIRGNAAAGNRNIDGGGKIDLAGSLAEPLATLDLAAGTARLRGNAALRPFSARPLGPATLAADALDLHAFDPALPQTLLDLRFASTADGQAELTLDNRAAGTHDAGRLPLSSLLVRLQQEDGAFRFDRIAARIGSAGKPAGTIDGNGRYADGVLVLALQADALNLRGIDSRLRPTRLGGSADLRHAPGRQEFTIGLRQPADKALIVALALDAHGVLADTVLSLDRATLQVGSGRAEAAARIALTGRQEFSMQGKLNRFRLEELGMFADAPQLFLNGEFALRGARQPALEADLSFSIADSRIAGQPLSGAGEVRLRGDRLQVSQFRLASGANRLNIDGELAEGDATLAFALDARQLAQLGPKFGGALVASGKVRGTFERPRIDAEWNARNLRLPGAISADAAQGKATVGIDRTQPFMLDSSTAQLTARGLRHGTRALQSLTAQLRFAPLPDAPLELALRAEGIAAGTWRAERFSADAHGTTAAHALDIALQEPGQPGQNWTIAARGGLDRLADDPRWQGSIGRFDASGRIDAHLPAPARLLLSAQRTELSDFRLQSDAGTIAVERFVRDADGIATQGSMQALRLAQLLQHVTPAPPVRTDLVLAGEWDVRAGESLVGKVRLRRESGDVTVLNGGTLTLGLSRLQAEVTADAGRLALLLQAHGSQLGSIDIDAGTLAGTGLPRIAPDAPLAGKVRIDVPSLRWLAPLVSPQMVADGSLQGDVTLGGTFGAPRIAGSIRGGDLRIASTALGIDLRQGTLQSEFVDDRLLIRHLGFRGSQGEVSVAGPIDFGGGLVAAELDFKARRFALFDRVDRRLIVSGDSRIALRGQQASVRGAFTVDSGFIDLGSEDKPKLSEDVVIVGRTEKPAAKTVADIDVTVALGKGVTLRGRGIDAVLVGDARITSGAGETPRVHGTLSIADGTFSAYGRKLEIEQGVLRFTGALNNPALDILAMRRGQEVEAGVSVRGTALQPRVTLISEPTVPDSEKLSWLVLGRGLASAGESDVGALQAAAAALLSQGAQAGVESRIASAFGLDTFSVGTSQDSLQQRIVTLGKQVSSRLYVSYQQGLESAGSAVLLRYTLSRKFSIEAQAGARSAISLFYNIAFD